MQLLFIYIYIFLISYLLFFLYYIIIISYYLEFNEQQENTFTDSSIEIEDDGVLYLFSFEFCANTITEAASSYIRGRGHSIENYINLFAIYYSLIMII